MKAATSKQAHRRSINDISIHAAREGGDPLLIEGIVKGILFQSTPPVKAATSASQFCVKRDTFQSTPPVKAATTLPAALEAKYQISIHAAREGGDAGADIPVRISHISIHAAREGGDEAGVQLFVSLIEFQSTPPVKAATCAS